MFKHESKQWLFILQFQHTLEVKLLTHEIWILIVYASRECFDKHVHLNSLARDFASSSYTHTVNSEIFVRILFSHWC